MSKDFDQMKAMMAIPTIKEPTKVDEIYNPQIMDADTCPDCRINFKQAKSQLLKLMLECVNGKEVNVWNFMTEPNKSFIEVDEVLTNIHKAFGVDKD